MGNSSSKNSQQQQQQSSRPTSIRHSGDRHAPPQPSHAATERLNAHVYSSRQGRGSRPDLSFLGITRDRESQTAAPERPRETKQEREARKVEKERQARLKERERSIREEHVDGGYLVTLGTYTGPEDFNKGIVRQLQIERRLAPFWKGLNDHSDSWTEAQLVAAARGLPIPAADEVQPDMARTGSQASSRPSDANINSLTVPITSRSISYESGTSANLSQSHPAFSSGPNSSTTPSSSTAQLFRGRAKTLASLATGSKSHSPDLSPQEIKLPKDPYVNGTLLEAVLYKDASECPICFLYYPPYLNKTRCCDQPICSECFVQIKRPDPHPPEHEQPGQPRPPEEEAETLVSEVASCPFCVTPEFGVSYDAPPFRRGLGYAHQGTGNLRNPTSAMSSTSSLGTPGGRRRATSLSANNPQVITTDRVRPDWRKKLDDARAHALRRSAAATALHNAAYVLGTQGDGQLRGMGGFRRRRTLFGDSPLPSGSGTPRESGGMMISPYGHVIRAGSGNQDGEDSGNDLFPARGSSRRSRVDDLEDLMMMEAIRLSLAAEEDRKRREEKEAKKDAKKKAKEEKKEAKQAEKMAKKAGTSAPIYGYGANESSSTWASTSMARSTSNLGAQPPIPEEELQGKGKAPAQDFAGFNRLSEPTSVLNTEMKVPKEEDEASLSAAGMLRTASDDPQRHLEESRANLTPSSGIPIPSPNRMSPHMRQLSNTSSAASSLDSAPNSLRADSNLPSAGGSNLDISSGESGSHTPAAGTPGLEPMLNFRSLAAMIGDEDGKDGREGEHIEHAGTAAEEELKEPSPTGSPHLSPVAPSVDGANRSRGDSGESSHSAPPPIYVENPEGDDVDRIEPVAQPTVRHDVDKKEIGNVKVLHSVQHEATQ